MNSTSAAGIAVTPDPLVSVVVVSWNTKGLLRDCLASTLVAAAELGRRVEVIVVDNASRDGSADMVASEFPSVRIIRNSGNAGFGAATNQGLRESRGRYLLLLNPDTRARRWGAVAPPVLFIPRLALWFIHHSVFRKMCC
jgi:hypothetical protein